MYYFIHMTYVLLGLKRAFSARIVISLLCVLVHIPSIKEIHNHVHGVYIVIFGCLFHFGRLVYGRILNIRNALIIILLLLLLLLLLLSTSSFSTTLCTVISNICILTACRN